MLDGDQESVSRLNAEIRKQMEQNKLLCMTTDPLSILMWAHYGEQQLGAVLGFRDVPELDSPWCTAKPVRYAKSMPRIWDNEALAQVMSGGASLNANKMLDALVYTKSVHWGYEKEWRIISGSGRNPDAKFEDIQFHPFELETIIFGSQMALEERLKIIAIISQPCFSHVHLQEIVRDDFDFKLTVRGFPATLIK